MTVDEYFNIVQFLEIHINKLHACSADKTSVQIHHQVE